MKFAVKNPIFHSLSFIIFRFLLDPAPKTIDLKRKKNVGKYLAQFDKNDEIPNDVLGILAMFSFSGNATSRYFQF